MAISFGIRFCQSSKIFRTALVLLLRTTLSCSAFKSTCVPDPSHVAQQALTSCFVYISSHLAMLTPSKRREADPFYLTDPLNETVVAREFVCQALKIRLFL
jgi:hypothetical protein